MTDFWQAAVNVQQAACARDMKRNLAVFSLLAVISGASAAGKLPHRDLATDLGPALKALPMISLIMSGLSCDI